MQAELQRVKAILQKHQKDIDIWLESKLNGALPLFTSIDMRNAGFKIAHVDANLFPAGFNNLGENGLSALEEELSTVFANNYPNIKRVLIYPENFTRNLKYARSLANLQEVLINIGLDVRIGSESLEDEIDEQVGIKRYSLSRFDRVLKANDGWAPEVIILNNDLTNGVPESLQDLDIPILPSPHMGWHKRTKHGHFAQYNKLLKDWCEQYDIDPWLLSAEDAFCGEINFRNKVGLTCLAKYVEEIISRIKEKYALYKIESEPFVFIKADKGTFGMGIMTVRGGDEVLNINKKSRHSMDVIKHGMQNRTVLIQEGVPTSEYIDGKASESLIYMCNGKVIDTFQRWHPQKDSTENLNSRGMEFANFCVLKDEAYTIKEFIARLSAVAVIYE